MFLKGDNIVMVLYDSITTMKDETQNADPYPGHELLAFFISENLKSIMFIQVLHHD
jgi:hypothetical protein